MNYTTESRTIVLCFDGTGNFFDKDNTNVVRLFKVLKKDDPKQIVYYQTGIGTYAAPGIYNRLARSIAQFADEMFAWFLPEHVMGGYTFLMQNYQIGDRICLFGFSRGAYTARALAGMLYKVGLLPKDNTEQIQFAYAMYKQPDLNYSAKFRDTFSRTVEIDFVGVWDTVASVGLMMSRHLPFTQSNHIICTFRQALSLDERRAKFQPNVYHRQAPDAIQARRDPELGSVVTWQHTPTARKFQLDDQWPFAGHHEAKRETRRETDVLEVWFAGCHSDVGGGSVSDETVRRLSDISLRWMIRECAVTQSGILFDKAALKQEGIPDSVFHPQDSVLGMFMPKNAPSLSATVYPDSGFEHPLRSHLPPSSTLNQQEAQGEDHNSPRTSGVTWINDHEADSKLPATVLDHEESLTRINDQIKKPHWWLLEVLPTFKTYQDTEGRWHKSFKPNLFKGRKIHNTEPLKLHVSVKTRMEVMDYKPKATWNGEPHWVE